MWFSSAHKTRRSPLTHSVRNAVRLQLEVREDRCLLDAGALDPTFGSGGLVSGGPLTSATAVVVQPDGTIVAAGAGNNAFNLTRYNASGSLDTTFGTNGVVTTYFYVKKFKTPASITGLALQSDGKIVAVGASFVGTKSANTDATAFTVARYNPNGSLDTTFGSGSGTVQTVVLPNTAVGQDAANAVAIDGSGKIDVAGVAIYNRTPTGSPYEEFALVRYNSNGTPDTTFGPGNNGIIVQPVFGGQSDRATALAIQSDGKIVLAGFTDTNTATYVGTNMALVRYTSAGQVDFSFGTNGIALTAPAGSTAGANGVLVQSDGGIVAAGNSHSGSSNYVETLARVDSTGHLDTTFGSQGFAINNTLGSALAIAQGPDGDLVAVGRTHAATYDFAVAAYLPGGAPDTTFGTGGMTTADFAGGSDCAQAVAIQGDGKIVAAGFTNPAALALARFLPLDAKVGSFMASPNPVTSGSSLTLTASNILESNPTSTITQVAFYLDTSVDGILDTGDTLLGYATQTSPGMWTFTFSVNLAPGTYILFAQAMDSNGLFSDPVALSLQVQ